MSLPPSQSRREFIDWSSEAPGYTHHVLTDGHRTNQIRRLLRDGKFVTESL